MDYYLDPELWFRANVQVNEEFRDVIMVPSWWMEYGMAAEPSILGDVATSGEAHRGKMRRTAANVQLIDQLGGLLPTEVVALPIMHARRTIALDELLTAIRHSSVPPT